jgi:hypothetical protein
MPFELSMHVARNHSTGGIHHKTYLLLEFGWSDKGRLIRQWFRSDQVTKRLVLPGDVFDLVHSVG